jgi:hypothetical protein
VDLITGAVKYDATMSPVGSQPLGQSFGVDQIEATNTYAISAGEDNQLAIGSNTGWLQIVQL